MSQHASTDQSLLHMKNDFWHKTIGNYGNNDYTQRCTIQLLLLLRLQLVLHIPGVQAANMSSSHMDILRIPKTLHATIFLPLPRSPTHRPAGQPWVPTKPNSTHRIHAPPRTFRMELLYI